MISQLNNFLNIPKIQLQKREYSRTQGASDIFVKSTDISFKGGRDGNKWVDIVGSERDTMGPKKYSSLSEEEKVILRSAMKPFGWNETLSEVAKAAKVLKASLDEEHGEGKWAYISIGRSCSILARALEFMGVEAKSIPISNLRDGVGHGSELIAREGFKDYKRYIYSLGLDPETVKNSGKTYIFEDYTDTGDSLKRFEEFLRTEEMGLNLDNIKFESINDRLEKISQKIEEYGEEDFDPKFFITKNIAVHSFAIKKYSSIPQVDCNNLQSINYAKTQAQFVNNLFEFGILDILEN